jgi:nucleotide-binding universal stress UspA family protein
MKRFKDILCIIESEEARQPALERAVMLAENNQANLTVVDVIERIAAGIGMPDGGEISAVLQDAIESTHAQKLNTLVDSYRKRIEIETRVLAGVPFLEIIREVLRYGHDLVIAIPETRDWLDRLFGSDDMHLLRKCPCPVWLIKPAATKLYRCILAAVDVDEACPPDELETRRALNRQILEMAMSLALSDFAELHIVNVWDAIGESKMRSGFIHMSNEQITAYVEEVRRVHAVKLNALILEVTGSLGKDAMDYLKPRTHLVKGWARKEIPALAKRIDADILVMGTIARTGIPGFIIGNTAETILNQIDCSVLAIKPPGFVTPVTLED